MSRIWKRSILLGLAVPYVVAGAWAVVAPASWYENFPGRSPRVVSALPPFNEHLAADTGAGLLATGLMMLVAGAWLRRDATVVALVGYLAFSVPHAVFHVRRFGEDLSTVENVVNSGVLWLAVVLAAAVLFSEAVGRGTGRWALLDSDQ